MTASLVLGCASASADPGQPLFCVHTNIAGAEGCFKASGDVLYAIDEQPEGRHAEVEAYIDDRLVYTCKNYDGYGTTKACNRDFPEHARICLKAFAREGDRATVVTSNYACTRT